MSNFGISQISLVAPSQGFTLLEDSVFFAWNEVGDEEFFELSLDNDISFVSPMNYTVFSSDTSILSIVVDQYFWRVRSFANGIFGDWSEIRTFRRIDLSAIGTLAFWYDATDLLPLGNGANISSWLDKSGLNYNQTQASVALQPTLGTNVLNEHPAVNFNGTKQLSNLTSTTFSTQFTFFTHQNSGNTAVLGLNTAAANPRFFNSLISQAISFTFSNAFTASNSRRNLTTNFTSPIGSYNLMSFFRTSPTTVASYCISPTHSGYARLTGSMFEIIGYQNTLSVENINQVENYLRFKYSPPVSLGKDVKVDYGFCQTTLNASGDHFVSHIWSNGATSPTINVNQNGTYWVQTTDVLGLVSTDTIQVIFPDINPPQSNMFCPNQSIIWNAGLGGDYTYLWSTGEITEFVLVDSTISLSVTVYDTLGCQKTFDPENFIMDIYPTTISLGADTSLCSGNFIELVSGATETVSYLWSDFSTNNVFNVSISGTITVQTTNANGCIGNDTISVTVTGQAPNVDFNAPDQCSNLAVNFTDLSSNIVSDPVVSWNWNFNDGGFSSDQNASHFYTAPGLYSVNLIVESQGGCSSQITKNVLVRQIPTSNFASSGQCSNADVQFSNSSANGSGSVLTYAWDFGMPSAGSYNFSVEINPARVYQDAGSYDVMLIATDEFGCKDTSIQTKIILQSPEADFTIDDNCIDSPFECTNTSIVEPFATYLWTFDDFTSSILANPYKVFSMAGPHEISLTVTAQNGCIDEFIDTIMIHPNPVASYEIGPNCFGTYMNLYSTSTISSGTIVTNSWSINDATAIVGDTIAHFVDLMGQNQVVLTSVSAEGCQNVINQFFDVTDTFNASFFTEGNVVSQGDDFLFTNTTQNVSNSIWDFGDGQSSIDFSPVHAYGADFIDSTLTVLLIAQSSSGCIDSANTTLQILYPELDLELQNLFTQNENGFYSIGVRMRNLGSKRIEKVDFLLRTQRGELFSEQWEGTLMPQESIVYLFVAKPAIGVSDQDDLESFVCVNSLAFDNENQSESFLDNNRLCKNLESESVVMVPIYPNPVVDQMTIEFLVTKSANVEIDLLDLFGRKVSGIQPKQFFEPGLSTILLNAKEFESGNYFIRLRSDDMQILTRIVILH